MFAVFSFFEQTCTINQSLTRTVFFNLLSHIAWSLSTRRTLISFSHFWLLSASLPRLLLSSPPHRHLHHPVPLQTFTLLPQRLLISPRLSSACRPSAPSVTQQPVKTKGGWCVRGDARTSCPLRAMAFEEAPHYVWNPPSTLGIVERKLWKKFTGLLGRLTIVVKLSGNITFTRNYIQSWIF